MKPAINLRLILGIILAALLAAHVAHANLVGYWNLNEGCGTTAFDASANVNKGTLNAGGQNVPSTWVAGHTGNPGDFAISFKGYTDRVVVPITNALNLTGTFTIALWAKADFLNSYPFALLFTNNSGGDARQWFFQGSNSGSDQMYVWSDANAAWKKPLGFKEGGTGTADINWHHYAFVYSGGVMTPYVDGVAKTPQTISGSPNFPSFTHLLIGGKNQVYTSWEGPIDDVVIFDSVEDVGSIKDGTHPAMVSTITRYEIWANCNGLTGLPGSTTDPASDADPDKDGNDNLAEFAFNGNPLSGSDHGYLRSATEDTNADTFKELTLTLAVRNVSGAPVFTGTPSPSASVDGITYTIEGSLGLIFPGSAVTETAAPTGLPALPSGWEYRRFRLDASSGLPDRGFLRARATQP